jgi:hypothetical protein
LAYSHPSDWWQSTTGEEQVRYQWRTGSARGAAASRPDDHPHEALGQDLPAEAYKPSQRPFPDRVEHPWYDADRRVRLVRSSGEIMWKNELVFVSEALTGEQIGIAELETGDYVVRFCDLDVGLVVSLRGETPCGGLA